MRPTNTNTDQQGAISPVKVQPPKSDISWNDLKKWIDDTNFFKK